MSRQARTGGIAGALAAAVAMALPATAAGSPCTKAVTDPAGDAGIHLPYAPQALGEAPANTDITRVELSYDGGDARRLTARISVAMLDRQVMDGFTRHRYDMLISWTRPNGEYGHAMLEAMFDINGAELFRYGHLEPVAADVPMVRIVPDGVTAGRLIEGAGGTVEIEVPAAAIGLEGSRVEMQGVSTSVEAVETAETEVPSEVPHNLMTGFTADFTESSFRLPLTCAAGTVVPPAVAAPAVTVQKALPRLRSKRLRSTRGKVRVPLACGAAAGCEAILSIGGRTVRIAMEPGTRTIAKVPLRRSDARRLRKGRRLKAVLRMVNGSRRAARRLTVVRG